MNIHDAINRTIWKFFRDLAVIVAAEIMFTIAQGEFNTRTLLMAASFAGYRVLRDVAPAVYREGWSRDK